MSVTYGFYNSISGDRKYNAEQMSALFDGIINDGVLMAIGDTLMVSVVSGMNIVVKSGRAWFNHTWTNNDTEYPLTVDQSEVVLNRIDTVILEVNANQDIRANSIKIIKGTPASSPVASTLTKTELLNQYPLANIYVGAGVTEITAANITNRIGTSDCPFVTGIIQTIVIDALVAQWQGEFDAWMATLDAALDENAAANLLSLLNEHKATDATTSQKGHIQIGTDATMAAAGDHGHPMSKITGVLPLTQGGLGVTTAAQALIVLGITALASELNFCDGVTSNIQTQLDAKLPKAGGTFTGPVSMGGNVLQYANIQGYAEVCSAYTGVSGTRNLDMSLANNFNLTLAGATTIAVTNPAASGKISAFTLQINMPATLYAITWPSSFKWDSDKAPTFTASKTAIITGYTLDGGAKWRVGIMGSKFTT
jgi:hypothetical protein